MTGPPEKPRSRLRDAGVILLAIIALYSLTTAWASVQSSLGVDFYQFWAVSQSVGRADLDSIYSNETRRRLGAEFLQQAQLEGVSNRRLQVARFRSVFETYSTPFLYASFGIFSRGNYERDLRVYRSVLIAGLLVGVGGLCRLLRYSTMTTLAAITLFAGWFKPFASELAVGNVNSLQLAALVLFLAVESRWTQVPHRFAAGMLLGLAVMFKPNLIFVLGLLLVLRLAGRSYRRLALEVGGLLAGAVLAFVYSAARFGTARGWLDWLRNLRELPDAIITVRQGNFSPSQLFAETIGLDLSPIVTALAFALAAGAVWWRGRRDTRAASSTGTVAEVRVVALGCAVMLLGSRLSWLHYYVLAIPVLLLLLRPWEVARSMGGLDRTARRIVPGLAVVGLSMAPLLNLGYRPGPTAFTIVFGFSMLAVYAACLLETVPRQGTTDEPASDPRWL